MTDWGAEQFQAFFQAVWGRPPFAWQTALAQRVLTAADAQSAAWPAAIALPTASGKTACLDVAVFALAAQAGLVGSLRRAPRRIFFVVDRRVIVDEAHDRAQKLAGALAEARDGILHQVAERLRELAGSDLPLAVQALRGGQPRSDDWAATPLQPTVVCSTVDQVGSRLLFRAYGPWSGMWPVHAGLVGNDALILLDEAHCAQPMLQTLQAVQRYRGWAEQPLPVPFEVAVLSATPPAELDESQVFRDTSLERRDPDHPLGRRQMAHKPARLKEATKAKGRNAQQRRSAMAVELAAHALTLAGAWARSDAPAIVVFCNRVDTARQVSHLLRKDAKTVHLLTGRMRPIDKDDVVADALAPLATATADTRRLQNATFVVATQTLEVGADLDFDLLVTECGSLDALRQRFGRLNRSGRDIAAQAVIVAAAHDTLMPSDDPVYGNALHATWIWLQEQAKGAATVDFGIASLEPMLPTDETLALLNAPSAQAPVLLPTHVDMLAQTAPVPQPSPDVSLFLHGPRSGPADVQICWRADLTTDADTGWVDALLRCPPSSPECLSVPYAQMRRWLDHQPAASGADVEGSPEDDEDHRPQTAGALAPQPRRALRWRGRDGSSLIEGSSALRPGDLLVLPASGGGFDELGTLGPAPTTDWGDRANASMRPSAVLRLHPCVIAEWPESPGRQELLTLLAADSVERWQEDARAFAAVLGSALTKLLPELHAARWSWLHALVQQAIRIQRLDRALIPHPCGGWIVHFRQQLPAGSRHGLQAARAFFADEDDAASSGHFRSLLTEPQTDGRSHLNGVGALAGNYAKQCGLPAPLIDVVQRSGDGHDLGKADPRFQSLLRNGVPWVTGPLLAKSDELPKGQREFLVARERAGYPHGGRHELLSVRLLESCAEWLPEDPDLRDLLLHLVESHHGHCRPFAPVVVDDAPVDVSLELNGQRLMANSATGLEQVDAGPADRFWRLTRRYGWWGLAWLESLLRLADHRRSEWEQRQQQREAA